MSQNKDNYRADIVVPCFHERDALPVTVPIILQHFRSLAVARDNGLSSFRLLLVDDGSKDETWGIIQSLSSSNPEIQGIKLSRNFGHQAAMMAGLARVDADVSITMDADLQDDITATTSMIKAYEGGADLALGVRVDRSSDTLGKRGTANVYYRLLAILGVDIIQNHADFRLMSRKALAALLAHQEVNLFLRGIIPTLGFPVVLVPYTRKAREQGETKYTLPKMLRLALDGITSFSIAPLRLIAALGALIFAGTLALSAVFLIERIFMPSQVVPGWASTVLPLLLLGGMQVLSIGVLGEYVGKIYLEVKRRPRFTVEQTTDDE